MKRPVSKSVKLASVLAFCLVGLSAIAPAFAGSDSDNVAVSASVSASCTIAASALSFGAYDPIGANAASPLDAQADLTVQCTNGAAASVVLDLGQNTNGGSADDPKRQMSDGGSNFMSYDLFSDAGHTTIWGNSTNSDVAYTGTGASEALTMFGRIPAGQNLPAGSYADTVLATINF